MQYFSRWRLDSATQRDSALYSENKQYEELHAQYLSKVEKFMRQMHSQQHDVKGAGDLMDRWQQVQERYLLESRNLRDKWQHIDYVLDKWHDKWHDWLNFGSPPPPPQQEERLKVKQVLEHIWQQELSALPLPPQGAHWLTLDLLYDYIASCKQTDTEQWKSRWAAWGPEIVFLQNLEKSLKNIHQENLSTIDTQWKEHQGAVERGELKNQATYFYLVVGNKRHVVSMAQHREQPLQTFVDFYLCKSSALVILPGFGSIPLKLHLYDLALPRDGLELKMIPLQNLTPSSSSGGAVQADEDT